MSDRRPRFAAAIAIAPLAAPIAVYAGLLVRALLAWPMTDVIGQGPAPHRGVAIALWFFIVLIFGAPPAYTATLLIVWPSARLLMNRGRSALPALVLVSALAGGAALPIYAKILAPRGHIDVFPGAGFLAGAATGLAFWFLAKP